jgi:hypothetical protein
MLPVKCLSLSLAHIVQVSQALLKLWQGCCTGDLSELQRLRMAQHPNQSAAKASVSQVQRPLTIPRLVECCRALAKQHLEHTAGPLAMTWCCTSSAEGKQPSLCRSCQRTHMPLLLPASQAQVAGGSGSESGSGDEDDGSGSEDMDEDGPSASPQQPRRPPPQVCVCSQGDIAVASGGDSPVHPECVVT